MNKYSGVIDTNILFSGLYSAMGASYQVLRLIEAGRIKPLLSTTLLFEYEDVLKRNQKVLKLSNQNVEDVLNGLCSQGVCLRVHFLWRPQLTDPKDDHILELAVAADGADIVTYNVKDFAKASSFGVRILKPATLLEKLK